MRLYKTLQPNAMADRDLRDRTKRISYAEQAEEDITNLMTSARSSRTFEEFKQNVNINTPRNETHHPEMYAPDLFMSLVEIQAFNSEFDDFLNLMYLHCKRKEFKNRGTQAIAPMQLDAVNRWVWKLFIGMEIDSDTLTYLDIEKILKDTSKFTTNERDALSRLRRSYKTQFLRGQKRKPILVDGITWMVDRDRDLPWMIPVSFNYHNPVAVSPMDATTSEMGECGRMVSSNEKLYQKDPYYKNLIRLALKLEKHMLFENLAEDGRVFTSLWHSWQVSCFVWTKPVFKLYAVPYGVLNYNIFVGVPSALVRAHRDKILIPKFTVMLPLTGEVRPLDYFVQDCYACQLYHKYKKGYSKSDPVQANLVYTLDTRGLRPGVGNGGFFANTTCIPNPSFILVPNTLGHKQGNVITKADFLYKHNTIIADRDFRGEDIEEIDLLLRNTASGIELPHESAEDDTMFVPLEWPYGKYEKHATQYTCQCLTHCVQLDQDGKSNIYMGNPAAHQREPHNWNKARVDATTDIKKTEKGYIHQYLANFARYEPQSVAMGPKITNNKTPTPEEAEPEETEYIGEAVDAPADSTDNVSDAVMGFAVDKNFLQSV